MDRHAANALLKARYAREKLDALDADVRARLSKDIYDVVQDRDADTGERLLKLVVNAPVDPSWSLMAGEVAYHLVCALNYTWQRFQRGADFPIYTDARRWLKPARRGRRSKADVVRDLLTEREWTVVSSIQPCNGSGEPDDHPLALVATLAGADKHDDLATLAGLTGVRRVGVVPYDESQSVVWSEVHTEPMEKGDRSLVLLEGQAVPLISFRIEPDPMAEVKMDVAYTTTVAFVSRRGTSGERVYTVDSLGIMAAFVTGVVETLSA